MAQLDTRIALAAQPPDLLGSYERGLSIRDLMDKRQVAEEERQAQRTLADLYRGNIDATGQVNRQGLVQGLAGAGLGARIPMLQKQFADADKAQLDARNIQSQIGERDYKAVKARVDASNAMFASLLSSPNITHDDVIRGLVGLRNQGLIGDDEATKALREVPGDPTRLRQFITERALQSLDAAKRLEMVTPKINIMDTGAGIQQFNTNQLTGQTTSGPTLARKEMTPGEVAEDARARATLAQQERHFQAGQANQFIPVEGVGLYVGDKRTGTARPVTGPDGQPVMPNKPLTEGQAKANLFGTRMREADQIISGLAAQGVASPSLPQQMTGGAGLSGRMATAAATPQQQQVDQAQRNFINAVLRRESGAAISPSEFDSARLQYFVQPGDSPQVIAQKARNRQTAISGMLAEVPEGKRGVGADDAGVPDDIAAILRKHGAK